MMNLYREDEEQPHFNRWEHLKTSLRTSAPYKLVVKLILKHNIKTVDPYNFKKMHKINDTIKSLDLNLNENLQKKFDDKMGIRRTLDARPNSKRSMAFAKVEEMLSAVELGDPISGDDYKMILDLINEFHLRDYEYEQTLSSESIQKIEKLQEIMCVDYLKR